MRSERLTSVFWRHYNPNPNSHSNRNPNPKPILRSVGRSVKNIFGLCIFGLSDFRSIGKYAPVLDLRRLRYILCFVDPPCFYFISYYLQQILAEIIDPHLTSCKFDIRIKFLVIKIKPLYQKSTKNTSRQWQWNNDHATKASAQVQVGE